MKLLPVITLCAVTAAFTLIQPRSVCAQDPAASGSPSAQLNFGDFSSSTLTTKAWQALDGKRYEEVAGYTGKCIEMFKAKAVEMQKALTAPPATDDKAKVFANWALNDVGTCYFILGKSLEAQGKPKDAVEAYKFVSENLQYAKCYDTKGWFWSPADSAKERVKALEFDSLK
ncbi:MAG: beta-glucanase precursor [Chthoniobacteraceae bacterium]